MTNCDYSMFSINDVLDAYTRYVETHTLEDSALDFCSELTGISIDSLCTMLNKRETTGE